MFPVFLLCVYFAFQFKLTKQNLRRYLVFAVIGYLVIVPWTVRNYIHFRQIIPVAAGSGGTFWIGSVVDDSGEFKYDETMEKIDEESGGEKVDVRRDQILMQKAVDNIVQNPIQYIGLVIKKFILYFTKIYEAVPHGGPRQLNTLVILGLALGYYPILLFFLMGLVLSRSHWRRLLPLYSIVLYSGIIYALTVVVPRYRAPLLPFFMVFAACSIDWLLRRMGVLSRKDPSTLSTVVSRGV